MSCLHKTKQKIFIFNRPPSSYFGFFTDMFRLNLKMRAFWDIAPFSLVEVDRRFTCAYCLHNQGDYGVSTHLGNVSVLQRYCTALYPRKLSSLYSPPWEPEMSHGQKLFVLLKYVNIQIVVVSGWLVKVLHAPQKFENPTFWNGWSCGIKKWRCHHWHDLPTEIHKNLLIGYKVDRGG
jgi:hypothetical protein